MDLTSSSNQVLATKAKADLNKPPKAHLHILSLCLTPMQNHVLSSRKLFNSSDHTLSSWVGKR